MRSALGVAAVAVALLAPVPSAEGAGAAPRVALSASPDRIAVVGSAARAVVLRNVGARAVVVDATRADLGRRSSRGWVRVVPRRLSLRPGAEARLTVSVSPPRRAEPGDHHALVLLTTRPLRGARLAVRMRLGLVVRVRVPGRIVHRLLPGRLRVRRLHRIRVLTLQLANRGNVTEELRRGRVTVSLLRRGRVVARLRPHARDLLPGTHGVVRMGYGGRLRGRVVARVEVRRGRGLPPRRRRYVVRL